MFTFPDKMLKVFKDDTAQEFFEKNGYVVLPFYKEEEMKELIDLYYRLHPKDEKGFFPSTFSNDKNYRTVADEEIRRINERAIAEHCQDIKVVCGCFIVKTPGPESGMCVHQDMSLVDESRFTGINIWVPLVDLSIENGTIFVLPGSHRIFPTYRGSTVPGIYEEISDEMIDYMEPLYLKAGEAVFFDQSVIHYSPPNLSDKIRIVTNTYFTHQDAEYRIYYYDKDKHDGCVEAFEEEESFMTDFEQFGHNIHSRPSIGKSLGTIPYDFPKIDLEYLKTHYKRINALKREESTPPAPVEEAPVAKKGILQRIKEVFA